MIELKIRKTTLRLDFSFFAVIAMFLLLDSTGFGVMALAACAAHELAHMIVMAIFGIFAREITFYGAGIRITAQIEHASDPVRAAILAAGCTANFLLAALMFTLGQPYAAAVSLFTGAFNLLPIGELDGAGLLKMLLIRSCKPENVDRTARTVGAVFAALCIGAVLWLGRGVSFTLLTTALYFIIVGSRRI